MQPELAQQMNSPAIDPALKPPAAETGSSSARNPAARRLRILEAATRLFLDEGYGQATTNALVRIVGGSKATLYSHFPSKEQLFGAVVDHVLARLVAATGDFPASGDDAETSLAELGEGLLELILAPDHIALARMVIGEAHRFPEIGAIYHAHGPALAQEGVRDFLQAHDILPGATSQELRDAAEWFTGRLIHRAFVDALCSRSRAPDRAELRRLAADTAHSFVRHFGRGGQARAL